MSITEADAGYTANPGHREFVDDIYCLKECIVSSAFGHQDDANLPSWFDGGEQLHSSQSAYVILGDDETLMFDTWSPASKDTVVDELNTVLDGRDLDYLVPSHPESNHAGNTWEILDAHPDATVFAPSRGAQHDLYGYDADTEYVTDGTTIDLGGRVVEFHEPIFLDHAMTTYLFEQVTETLFTVDWFGFQHMASECLKCVDEMKYDIAPDQLERFTGYAFVWMRFADPDRTDAAIDRLMATTDPSVIAPAHGQIIREDVPRYMDLMKSVIRDVTETGADTHVHTHQMNRYGGTE